MTADKTGETTMHPKTLLTLPLLIALASSVLAEDDKALLAKCDGMTRAGTIDPALEDGVIGELPEKKCVKEAKLAKGKEDLAKLQKETDQLIEILAMLDAREVKTYLRDEVQKAENRLATAKANGDQRTAKSIEYRLDRLKGHQQKLQ